uniref:Uncharacterized protein n=1 Tax=Mustela putorius furo TaxID=9669 RepID=M3YBW7_MUSPF
QNLGRGSLTGREAGNVEEEPDDSKPLAAPDPGPSQKGKDSLKDLPEAAFVPFISFWTLTSYLLPSPNSGPHQHLLC